MPIPSLQGPRIAPRALRQQIWIHYNGQNFHGRCAVPWCTNPLTVFTFEAGHNIPYSRGGTTTLDNMRPLCNPCNSSMGNAYTIDEWSRFGQTQAQAQAQKSREKLV